MKRYLIPTILILAIGGMVYFSVSTGTDPEAYATSILEEREKKEAFLRRDPDSPFRGHEDSIRPLRYFAPDLTYRIMASLEPVQQKQVRILQTSTGEQERYLDYAWASFELAGQKHRLLILEVMDMGPNRGKLFLAFADETSAKETYGGGRYLDLKKVPAATSIEIDFNKAYNPYCSYNENYSCPFPPSENILPVAIQAGEKVYH